jgi:hypothetical protein
MTPDQLRAAVERAVRDLDLLLATKDYIDTLRALAAALGAAAPAWMHKEDHSISWATERDPDYWNAILIVPLATPTAEHKEGE